jgi:hypothetical protein
MQNNRQSLKNRQDAMRQRFQGAAASPLDDETKLTVQTIAGWLNKSDDWVRSHFKHIRGTLIIPSTRRRGKRKYDTMLIPYSVYKAATVSWSVRLVNSMLLRYACLASPAAPR